MLVNCCTNFFEFSKFVAVKKERNMCKIGSDWLIVVILVMVWISSPNSHNCDASPVSSINLNAPSEAGPKSYHQLHAYIRDVLKYLEKVNKSQPKQIAGQVSLRASRSELGEFGRLYHLQELDRLYGTKNRPRFGKRVEATQVDGPSYGQDYNNMFEEDNENR